MLFPTLDYLVFLALIVTVYWLLPRGLRLLWLGASSIFFYASWNPAHLPVWLGVTLLGWGTAGLLARLGRKGTPQTAWIMGVGTVAMLAPLLYCKYWPWIAESANTALGWAGLPGALPVVDVPLPIGVSFFTFQVLAYVIDVRKGADPEPSPLRFVTFIGLFPHLVAGPIVRAHELLPALRALPSLQRDMVGRGLYRIGLGMLKKIVLADVLAQGVVDPLFADPERFSGIELAIGLYAYTLQIYCDFSAYTDIAIGSALLLGFELPENFKRPYKAASVAAFWRRWHMTLSSWVRDYVYFPMGGARVDASWKIYRNLMLTLLILGVWHGASWNFVLYGLMHGAAVCLNRWQRKRAGRSADDDPTEGWPWFWRMFLTLNFVVFARILFRAEDLEAALAYTVAMFDTTLAIPRFSYTALAILGIGYAAHFTPERWEQEAQARFVRGGALVWAIVLMGVAAACATLGTGETLSFIYYAF